MIIEIITYITYIYSLICIFINIQPKPIYFIIFYIYCFLSTYLLTNYCIVLKNEPALKLTIIAIYSLISTFLFYFINKTWKYYKKNKIYILFLIILPVIYIINIKNIEKLGDCGNIFYLSILTNNNIY